jgi:hypothetical protein
VLSFRALLREQEGVAFFLIAGIALLIVGAILLFIASRTNPIDYSRVEAPDGSAETTNPPIQPELLGGRLGYVAMALSIAFAIAFTVYVIVQGISGGIFFLIWILFGGFAILFLARKQAERSARRSNTQ